MVISPVRELKFPFILIEIDKPLTFTNNYHTKTFIFDRTSDNFKFVVTMLEV